jgi:hypothetical protein
MLTDNDHDDDGSDNKGVNLEISEQEYSDELEYKVTDKTLILWK